MWLVIGEKSSQIKRNLCVGLSVSEQSCGTTSINIGISYTIAAENASPAIIWECEISVRPEPAATFTS
jgi:hypothetical protein